MRVVGLVSTFEDGPLAATAVRSLLTCCDKVIVLDGPIGENEPGEAQTDWTEFGRNQRVTLAHGRPGIPFPSDAVKRTCLLGFAKRREGPLWGIVVDGDEALIDGAFLRDYLYRADQQEAVSGQANIGLPLRLMELDGSCSVVNARVLRLDRIEAWVLSGYHLRLVGGVEVAKPNMPLLAAGEPDMAELASNMQRRRPVAGEPHILHRSMLRDPRRRVERQHEAEATEFERLDVHRLGSTEKPDERVRLWLPS